MCSLDYENSYVVSCILAAYFTDHLLALTNTTDLQMQGLRQLVALDSAVCVGALGKGRSSSFKLNGIMMGLLPYLVVANLSVAAFWIGTKSNPADHPSRGTPLPSPMRPPDLVRGFLPDFRERAWG